MPSDTRPRNIYLRSPNPDDWGGFPTMDELVETAEAHARFKRWEFDDQGHRVGFVLRNMTKLGEEFWSITTLGKILANR